MMDLTQVNRELVDVLVGIAVMLGVAFVVLLDLYVYWAKDVEERQADLEKRIKALEERG